MTKLIAAFLFLPLLASAQNMPTNVGEFLAMCPKSQMTAEQSRNCLNLINGIRIGFAASSQSQACKEAIAARPPITILAALQSSLFSPDEGIGSAVSTAMQADRSCRTVGGVKPTS